MRCNHQSSLTMNRSRCPCGLHLSPCWPRRANPSVDRAGGLCLLLFILIGTMPSPSDAGAPTIQDISPLAITPGATQQLSITGKELTDVVGVWTSFPSHSEIDAATSGPADSASVCHCQMSASRDEPIGIGAIRILTRAGVSNCRLVMIDDLPTVAELTDHDRLARGQPVAWPVAIEGRTDALKSDYYRFQVQADTQLSFEVVAMRLGSTVDSLLTLYDASGQELISVDDDSMSGADSRFSFHFDQAGEYHLSIRDVQYRGGASFRYRLRIGRFPLIRQSYPLGGALGSLVNFHFLDSHFEPLAAQFIHLQNSSHHATRQRFLSLKLPGHDASGFVSVRAGSEPELLELEPNDTPSLATPLPPSGTINGRFQSADDVDFFAWTADQEQSLLIEMETSGYSPPTQLDLQWLDATGAALKQTVISQPTSYQVSTDFPLDGKYFLRVENLLPASGSQAYRFHLRAPDPGFALTTDSDTLNFPQGGEFSAKVTAQRTSYTGAIELSVESADGAGLLAETMEPLLLPAGANQVQIKAPLAAASRPGDLHIVRIVGRAVDNPSAAAHTASTSASLLASVPDAYQLPLFLEGLIAVGITSPLNAAGETVSDNVSEPATEAP